MQEPAAKVVETADERQLPWTPRHPPAGLAAEDDDMDDEREDDAQAVEEVVWQAIGLHSSLKKLGTRDMNR
jgi:hypothetical protein